MDIVLFTRLVFDSISDEESPLSRYSGLLGTMYDEHYYLNDYSNEKLYEFLCIKVPSTLCLKKLYPFLNNTKKEETCEQTAMIDRKKRVFQNRRGVG